MALYQATYKQNSRTHSSNIEASSVESVKQIFKALTSSSLFEIKEYLYVSNSSFMDRLSSDNNNYRGNAKISVYFKDDSRPVFLRIPKIKKTVSDKELVSAVKNLYKNVEKVTVSISSKT